MQRNEVVFRLGSADLSVLQFGISPGHELCHAVRVLKSPNRHPLQWGWVRAVQGRVPAESLDLLALVIGPRSYFPDFLTAPPSWQMTPEDDLAALSATPVSAIRADLTKVHRAATGRRRAAIAELLRRPIVTRRRLAQAWADVWQSALAPHWDALRRLHVADIALRSRTLATSGIAATVDGLHERVSWEQDEVRVRMQHWSEIVPCEGQGLLLVPSAFAHPHCSVLTEKPVQPTLFYPVHGLSERWLDRDRSTRRSLAALMGDSRARVLDCLDGPRSTTDTATACHLAISTASRHLTLLREAGLITTAREGSQAQHVRTILGDALVSGDPHP